MEEEEEIVAKSTENKFSFCRHACSLVDYAKLVKLPERWSFSLANVSEWKRIYVRNRSERKKLHKNFPFVVGDGSDCNFMLSMEIAAISSEEKKGKFITWKKLARRWFNSALSSGCLLLGLGNFLVRPRFVFQLDSSRLQSTEWSLWPPKVITN